MTMQIAERDHNPCGLFGWFNYERRNWVAGVAVALCLGYAVGNGHTTQDAIADKNATINRLVTKDIPKLKSVAGCEHLRAQTAVGLAQSGDDPANIPNCPSLASAKALGKLTTEAKK